MKKQNRKRTRTSRLDRLTAATMQDAAHQSSEDIRRRRDVLTFELVTVEQEITMLRAKVADAHARKARLDARLLGLGMTIAKR